MEGESTSLFSERQRRRCRRWLHFGEVVGVLSDKGQLSPWWQDPEVEAERLPKIQYLKERLDAINTEFGYYTGKAKKLQMIKTLR